MRRSAGIVGLAVLLLAAAWLATWWVVGRHFEGRVVAWIEQQRAEGVEVTVAELRHCGVPTGWTICARDVVVARRQPTFREWRAAMVEASMVPWRLDEVALLLPGPQRATRETPWRAAETIQFEAARPEAWLRLERGRAAALRVDFGDLTMRRLTDGSTASARRLRFAGTRLDPPDERSGDSLRVTLDLDDVVLPAPPAGFADRVRTLAFEAALRGAFDPERPPREAVAAWRDGGGTLEIRRFALDWAPMTLDGDGTLALDALNRPLGAFTLRATGYAEALDATVQAGALRPREAAAVKAALNLIARADGPEGRRQVRLPLTMQDGRLSVAGFAVQRLEPLRFE